MKYCKFCGKKLEEGEVCSCQSEENETSFFKDIDKNKISSGMKKVLVKPDSGAKQITASFSLKESAAVWLGEGIITGICLMILVSSTLGASNIFWTSDDFLSNIFFYSLLFCHRDERTDNTCALGIRKTDKPKSGAAYVNFMPVPCTAPINILF